VSSSLG